MRDPAPALPVRAYRKLRGLTLASTFMRYKRTMEPDHPFGDFPMRIVADVSADPTESFDHYDAFAFWASERIASKRARLALLDVGSIKMMNAITSATNNVTSLVLADCGDTISNVKYLIHDVSDDLPFRSDSFDVFTSMASLNLIGLGRYGDKLNPYCLPNLVGELDRVLRPKSMVLVSMCLGPNLLNFNNGWFFEMDTLKKVFHPWPLIDYLVDNASSPKRSTIGAERFVKDSDTQHTTLGDYRVVFLHFER